MFKHVTPCLIAATISALIGCGVPMNNESTLGSLNPAAINDVTIKIDGDSGSSSAWIMVATPTDMDSFVVCVGPCQESMDASVPVQQIDTVGDKAIYRSLQPVQLVHDMQIEVASIGISTTDGSKTYTRLKRIQIRDKGLVNMPTLADGDAGSFELKLDEVYRQGGTNWCWAYAAFHTMKVYFNHRAPTEDPKIEGFREFIQKIDSSQGFRSFLGRMVSTGERGMPTEFLSRIRSNRTLPQTANMPWTNLRGSRRAIVNQVVKNLKKGIPTAYCYPGHCVTIYGFQTDGQQTTSFSIADSANGSKSRRSISTVINNHTALWSLPEMTANQQQQQQQLVSNE